METKVIITQNQVFLDHKLVFETESTMESAVFFKELYKFLNLNYIKFFKMDPLSKLGFVASELLFQQLECERTEDFEIILACSSSSLESDNQFQSTINDPNNYFPSPSVFVYTLPNIVIGEIAIRHKIMGNNCMYIISPDEKDLFFDKDNAIYQTLEPQKHVKGYLDYYKNKYFAEFLLTINK
jgi:hypothetical protein